MLQYLVTPNKVDKIQSFDDTVRWRGFFSSLFLNINSILLWIVIIIEFSIHNNTVGGLLLGLQLLTSLIRGISEQTALNYRPISSVGVVSCCVAPVFMTIIFVLHFVLNQQDRQKFETLWLAPPTSDSSSSSSSSSSASNSSKILDFLVAILFLSAHLSLELGNSAALLSLQKSIANKAKCIPKSLNDIVNMALVDVLITDMTGTVTENEMKIEFDEMIKANRFLSSSSSNDEKILLMAACGCDLSADNNDPIDAIQKMILDKFLEENSNASNTTTQLSHFFSQKYGLTQTSFQPFDPRTKRSSATILSNAENSNSSFDVTIGSANVILDLCFKEGPSYQSPDANSSVEAATTSQQELTITSDDESRTRAIVSKLVEQDGFRVTAVATRNNNKEDSKTRTSEQQKEEKWKLIGLIPFCDTIRSESHEAIARAKRNGICVKLVTGYENQLLKRNGRKLGLLLDKNNESNFLTRVDIPKFPDSADLQDLEKDLEELDERSVKRMRKGTCFGQFYPEHKFLLTAALQHNNNSNKNDLGYKCCATTGDSASDCFVLKRAVVGIASYGATDMCRDAGNLIPTEPGLMPIVSALAMAKNGLFKRKLNSFWIWRLSSFLRLFSFCCVHGLMDGIYLPAGALMLRFVIVEVFLIIGLRFDTSEEEDDEEEEADEENYTTTPKNLPMIQHSTAVVAYGVTSTVFLVLQLVAFQPSAKNPLYCPRIFSEYPDFCENFYFSPGQLVIFAMMTSMVSDALAFFSFVSVKRSLFVNIYRSCWRIKKKNPSMIIAVVLSIVTSCLVCCFGFGYNTIKFEYDDDTLPPYCVTSMTMKNLNDLRGLYYYSNKNQYLGWIVLGFCLCFVFVQDVLKVILVSLVSKLYASPVVSKLFMMGEKKSKIGGYRHDSCDDEEEEDDDDEKVPILNAQTV